MKKRTLLLLSTVFALLALSSPAFSQKKTPPPLNISLDSKGSIYYEGVVELDPSMNQNGLYMKGREWFVNTYSDADAVLQMDDKAEGKLMGKGLYKYSFINGINGSNISLRFILNLDIKDGKYRYRIYSFRGDNENQSYLGGSPQKKLLDYDQIHRDYLNGKRQGYNGKVLAGLDTQVQFLIASLKAAMSAPSASAEF